MQIIQFQIHFHSPGPLHSKGVKGWYESDTYFHSTGRWVLSQYSKHALCCAGSTDQILFLSPAPWLLPLLTYRGATGASWSSVGKRSLSTVALSASVMRGVSSSHILKLGKGSNSLTWCGGGGFLGSGWSGQTDISWGVEEPRLTISLLPCFLFQLRGMLLVVVVCGEQRTEVRTIHLFLLESTCQCFALVMFSQVIAAVMTAR